MDEIGHGGVGEGLLPGQRLVQHRPQAVDITLGGQGFIFYLFRGDVVQGADDGPFHRQPLALTQFLGDAEVGQVGVPFPRKRDLVKQDVGRLDIPVDHPLAVGG